MSKKRRSPIALSLVKNSRSAMLAAVELHNKPVIHYRYEMTVLLVLNAWELILKAYIYKYISSKWLYTDNDRTKPFEECLNKVVHHFGAKYLALKENLRNLYKYRNDVAHFYTEKLDVIIFGLLKQNVVFYSGFLKLHFNYSIDEGGDFILLPLGFKKPFSPIDFITNQSFLKESSKEVRDFLKSIIDSTKLLASHSIEEPILVDYTVNLTNVNKVKNADIVAGIDNSIKNLPVFTVSKKTEGIQYIPAEKIDQIKFTNDANSSSGYLLHNELSETLFDEINNIIEANNLIDKGNGEFHFGEQVYYKIYADRDHVFPKSKNVKMLANAVVSKFYAPFFHWITLLSPNEVAKLFSNWCSRFKNPNVYGLFALATLLGEEGMDYTTKALEKKYGRITQPPNFYYSFKDQAKKKRKDDIRLNALRMSSTSKLNFINERAPISLIELLRNHELAKKLLSNECISMFKGNKESRRNSRILDIIVYGHQIQGISGKIITELEKVGSA